MIGKPRASTERPGWLECCFLAHAETFVACGRWAVLDPFDGAVFTIAMLPNPRVRFGGIWNFVLIGSVPMQPARFGPIRMDSAP